MCFMSSPSMPAPPPDGEAPAEIQQPEKAQSELRNDATEKARKAAGLQGTNLTGGLTTQATTLKKTLLGA